MATAVNFFDTRNPARGLEGEWNPEAAPQNFTIAVTDAEGNEGTVEADNPDFGTATQQTLGSTSDRVHVILRDLRVPLAEFEEQGVNLEKCGTWNSGSAAKECRRAVRSSWPTFASSSRPPASRTCSSNRPTPNAGPGTTGITSGPNPVEELEEGTYARADGEYEIPNVTTVPGANVWTVDDDKAQCPNAEFTNIQEAVENASPWDTIVVCPGVYEESSTPVNSELNPVLATGETNGLTIKKPLKIIGAGASEVTIKPKSTVTSLGGATGTLRDGGGNVITVSRQSLGSSEYDEEYVDISGVTIESGSTEAEAGVAFFNSSGRIADSVIKSIKPSNGNGWGVVETDSQLGTGVGSPERQVTIEDSTIKGYGAGGVLFDGSKGKADGTVTNTERSLMNQVGYVFDSTIEGAGGSSTAPQTGIAYRSGASGEVTGSAVVNNQTGTGTGSSYGILAADAGALTVEESNIVGNGTPASASTPPMPRSPGSAPKRSKRATTTGVPVARRSSKVLGPTPPVFRAGTPPRCAAAPVIPPVPALLPDAAPVGEIVNPIEGEAAEVGVTSEPVVFAEDDYGVKSVSLTADGVPVETLSEAPYSFSLDADGGRVEHLGRTRSHDHRQCRPRDHQFGQVPVVKVSNRTEERRSRKRNEEAELEAGRRKSLAEAIATKKRTANGAAETTLKEATASAEAAAKAARISVGCQQGRRRKRRRCPEGGRSNEKAAEELKAAKEALKAEKSAPPRPRRPRRARRPRTRRRERRASASSSPDRVRWSSAVRTSSRCPATRPVLAKSRCWSRPKARH